jgi:hypothetical protein
MKPRSYTHSKKFTLRLTDDNRKSWVISMKELFDGFDVKTLREENECTEFIMGAF